MKYTEIFTMKTSRFSDSQVLAILKQAGNGVPVTELCREHGMSSPPFISCEQSLAAWTPRLWHG